MQMLMRVQIPNEPFNTFVRDGSGPKKIQKILEAIKPRAAYFTAHHGQRGGILVVDLKSPSEIPRLAEPFFLVFNASVEFEPYMTPEDLGQAGIDEIGKAWA